MYKNPSSVNCFIVSLRCESGCRRSYSIRNGGAKRRADEAGAADLTALVGTFRLANADDVCDVRFPLTRGMTVCGAAARLTPPLIPSMMRLAQHGGRTWRNSKTFRIGVIGAGWAADGHIAGFNIDPRAQVVGVANRTRERAEATAKKTWHTAHRPKPSRAP